MMYQVVDGTSCDDEGRRICVDGECSPVGCDGLLGSDTEEDKCRVCGGDGSSCQTVTGVMRDQDLQMGYNDMSMIPAGATNIVITEVTLPQGNIRSQMVNQHIFR